MAIPTLRAQLTTQGEPAVGNSTQLTTSQAHLDATLFSGADMCASIAAACAALGTTSYPAGATIDARGFTGINVCKAVNITTMLNGCVGGSGHNGGKLLLGNVNLYADGPASPATTYSDGLGSGVGTPALIIPSFFWGIEGISRGALGVNSTTAGIGTFLSVCTGTNTPVQGCHNPFPQRSFGISSTSIAGTTMTIALSTSPPAGSFYSGELAMVKGNNVPANNGTFKIQSFAGSTVTVTVPSGTLPCSSSCGTLWLGTPILGFGPSAGVAYNGCATGSLCAGFGQHIKNLGFNCQNLDGCIGWQNLYGEEEGGADTFVINNYSFVGVDIHGFGSQNFGPVLNAEIYTGPNNMNCDFGTTGIYMGDAETRGLNGWTINQDVSNQVPLCRGGTMVLHKPIAAVLLDAMNTEVRNGHCEGFDNCVLIGANNGSASGNHASGIVGGPAVNAGTNVVQVSGNYKSSNGNYVVERIRRNNSTNAVMDNINSVTLSDNFISLYAYAGIRAGAIRSGVNANTDLAGSCRLGTNCVNIPFSQSYSNKPICTCSDTSGTVAACNAQVALGSPTTLTLVGSGTHTLNYIGR
ncbi:MAG: hypothetical protein WB711_17930 [Terriglobales bacterium]